MYFLGCLVDKVGRSSARRVHTWASELSRTANKGEFDPRCKDFQILVGRMVLEGRDLSGPASAVLLDAPNSFIDHRNVGIIAPRPIYGMRIYPENSASTHFKDDPFQPQLSAPAMMMLYYKYCESGKELPLDGKRFSHNETTIKVDENDPDVHPFVIDLDRVSDAQKLLKDSAKEVRVYDQKKGAFYNQDSVKIEFPENVFSINNMRSNSKMFELAQDCYHYDLELYSKWLLDLSERNKEVSKELEEIKEIFALNPRDVLAGPRKNLEEMRNVVADFSSGSSLLLLFARDLLDNPGIRKSGIMASAIAKVSDNQNTKGGGGVSV